MIADWMEEVKRELKSGKYPVERVHYAWRHADVILLYRLLGDQHYSAIQTRANWRQFLRDHKPRLSYGLKKG